MSVDVAPACKSPPCAGLEPGSKAARSEREDTLSFEEMLERKKKEKSSGEQPDPSAAIPVMAPPSPVTPPPPASEQQAAPQAAPVEGVAAEASMAAAAAFTAAAETPGADPAASAGELLAALAGEAAGEETSPAADLKAASASLVAAAAGETAELPAEPAVDELLAAAQAAVTETMTAETAEIQKAGAQGAALPVETASAPAAVLQAEAEAAAPEPVEQVFEMAPERAKETPRAQEAAVVDSAAAQAQAAGKTNQAVRTDPMIAAQEPARMAEASQELLQQVTENIRLATTQNGTTMRVQLHPHELGSIDIRLVSNQNGVGIMVLAERAATGRLLESQMAQLQQAVVNVGVQVSQLWVGQNPQSDAQASLFTQQRGDQHAPGGREQNFPGSQKSAAQSGQARKTVRYSMIDYRA